MSGGLTPLVTPLDTKIIIYIYFGWKVEIITIIIIIIMAYTAAFPQSSSSSAGI